MIYLPKMNFYDVSFEYMVGSGLFACDYELVCDRVPYFYDLKEFVATDGMDDGELRAFNLLQHIYYGGLRDGWENALNTSFDKANIEALFEQDFLDLYTIKDEAKALDVSLNEHLRHIAERSSFGADLSEHFYKSKEKESYTENLAEHYERVRMGANDYSYEDFKKDVTNFRCACAEYILLKSSNDLRELIEQGGDNYSIFHKKGYFREFKNEHFLDNVLEKIKASADNPMDYLKDFYENIDITNRGDVLRGASKIFDSILTNSDFVELYVRNKDAICDSTDSDLEDFSPNELDYAMKVFTIEAMACMCEKLFDKQYAKDELEFYKVEMQRDYEERELEAHGEFESEDDEAEFDDNLKPKAKKRNMPF